MGCDCCGPPKAAPGDLSVSSPTLDEAQSVISDGANVEVAEIAAPAPIEEAAVEKNDVTDRKSLETQDLDSCDKPAEFPIESAVVSTVVKQELAACNAPCCAKESNVPNEKNGASIALTEDKCCDSDAFESKPDINATPACCEGKTSPCCTKEPSVPNEKIDIAPIAPTVDKCCDSSSLESKPNSDTPPPCCEGKTSPCCDTSCLDRLALRECEIRCSEPQDAPPRPGSSKYHPPVNGKACSQHRRSTRERYGATLQALGCICRALLARGLESCCETRQLSSIERKKCGKKSQSSLRSVDSFCTSTALPSTGKPVKRRSSKGSGRSVAKGWGDTYSVASVQSSDIELKKDKCGYGCCSPEPAPVKSPCNKGCCSPEPAVAKSSCADGCCSPKPASPIDVQPEKACTDGCCTEKPASPPEVELKKACNKGCCSTKSAAIEPTCIDDCCSEKPALAVEVELKKACNDGCCSPKPAKAKTCTDGCCTQKPAERNKSADCCSSAIQDKAPTENVTDIERQLSGTEHVVLSISGMTCTGCEVKLNRTLATVPAVKNLKTSLILARVEFDLQLEAASAEDIIKHLERTTEFKCTKIVQQGSSVDILTPSPSALVNGEWPTGVLDISVVDKNVVCVSFDPTIIGARDLADKGWDQPQVLAPPRPDPSLEAGSKHVTHLGYLTLLSAVLTIPVLVLAWAPLPERQVAYSSASLALATIVQVVIAGPFYPKALKALLFSRVIEMDLLIVLSTSAAYIFSVVAFGFLMSGKPLDREQFFETSTLLVTLIMVGRYVAALARQKAIESISLRSLQASTAILVGDDGSEREIDARLLQYGDIFKVVPDTSIPTDGTVMTGSSEVDESMLTGESHPVEKYPKSPVIAGSINGSGTLVVRLTRLPGDNTINAIAAMVDEAKLTKPKMQALADKVASYFVPVVVVLAIITFVTWIGVGIRVRHYSGSKAAVEAISYAITVLIVSCPCAIGLAVPMVVVIASGVGAKRGVVFKSADAIEVAYKASHVVFDKTGTLTEGKLSVMDAQIIDEERQDSLSLLLGLIGNIRHPVSIAVATHLKEQGIEAASVPEPRSLTGRGVEAILGDKTLRAGNSRWLNASSHPIVSLILSQGYTAFCFTIDDKLIAVYGLEDSIRPDALETISALQSHDVSVHLVSGDDDAAVQKVANALAIPNVRSRCSPADKQTYINALLQDIPPRGKAPIVIFCGDGTNDAVALAQATIGVHMNSGTDVAKSAADVVLMRPDLSGIQTMMNLSRAAVNRIKFNFGWSFVYNLLAVLMATGALVSWSLPPEFAGLGELVSVVPVIIAAVLLRWSHI